jgi:hypothetical protein
MFRKEMAGHLPPNLAHGTCDGHYVGKQARITALAREDLRQRPTNAMHQRINSPPWITLNTPLYERCQYYTQIPSNWIFPAQETACGFMRTAYHGLDFHPCIKLWQLVACAPIGQKLVRIHEEVLTGALVAKIQ